MLTMIIKTMNMIMTRQGFNIMIGYNENNDDNNNDNNDDNDDNQDYQL